MLDLRRSKLTVFAGRGDIMAFLVFLGTVILGVFVELVSLRCNFLPNLGPIVAIAFVGAVLYDRLRHRDPD